MSTPPKPLSAETPLRRSLLIYLVLMVYLILVKIVLSLASVKVIAASQEELFRWPLIGVLVLAGGISVWLGPRMGLPGLWDASISTRKRLLLPAVVGLGLGAVNLALQAFTGYVHVLAAAAHVSSINVAFPASLLFYSAGAIILEAIYRLILITLPLWLIANVILRKRGQTQVFWVLALLTSALEPAAQMTFLAGHLELMLVAGVALYGMNVFEADLLRRYGFLAPLVFRVALYVVWHIVGGAIGF
jgi:hypothetical protein